MTTTNRDTMTISIKYLITQIIFFLLTTGVGLLFL